MVATILEYSYTLITFFSLWYTLRKTLQDKQTLTKKIIYWIVFGIIFNLYSLSWVYTVYPLLWMNEGLLQLLGITILHILSACTAGISFGVVGYVVHIHIKKILQPFIFAVSLIFAEIGRSLLLSTLYYGNNSTIGLHWTAGTIGNALSTTPFIEFAYFGGTFMLTGVMGYFVYTCTSLNSLHIYKKHIFSLCIILCCIHFLLPTHGPKKPITVAVITTNFIQKKDTSKEYLDTFFKEKRGLVHEMTKQLASSSPDMIVYPEDTRYIQHNTSLEKRDLTTLFKQTLFIDSGTQKKQTGLSTYTLAYSPSQEKTPIRGKQFLMLFNEYIPVFFMKIFTLFMNEIELKKYTEEHTYALDSGKKSISFNGVRIGTIICSEILSFSTMDALAKEKPDILIYQSHLSVFHNNPWFVMHMRSFTKITAAQMRTPLINSSNGSPSFIISPYGSVVDMHDAGFFTSLYNISQKNISVLSK